MSEAIKRVVIVGGGSAGWLTAAVIAAEHRADTADGLEVTLVESPDVAPIGVGEGTWPTMRDTLRRIGVSESDFFRECDASFKQGSKFARWSTGDDGDYYYHPFVLPHGYADTNLVAGWRLRHPDVPFADLVSFQPHLCEQGRAPKQIGTPEYAAVANYAYHLDAGKFALFLRRHCTERLGVRHVVDHVVGVVPRENGDVAAVRTAACGELAGDLFVDCTGFAALLLGRHYGVPFVGRRDVLFSDRAIAVQVPYADEHAPVAPYTLSTAQVAGWIWDIGLPTRRGVGYVYSSDYTDDDDAERTLREYVASTAGADVERGLQSRRIRIEPGHRAEFWHRNCVAVGLSAGFLEPLEASALVLIELSAAMIADDLPATRSAMAGAAARFNECFRYRWDRVVEFLKLHYVLSQRTDGAFWCDNRRGDTIPARLAELLEVWRHRPPSRYDFPRAEEVFPSASHQYVLYGMGFVPETPASARRRDDADAADRYFRETADTTRRLLGGLPDNRHLLEQVRRHGFPRI